MASGRHGNRTTNEIINKVIDSRVKTGLHTQSGDGFTPRISEAERIALIMLNKPDDKRDGRKLKPVTLPKLKFMEGSDK